MNITSGMNKLKAEISKRTSDSRFFSATKKGELHELREELNSSDTSKQKNAIKKVIANMTLGRDVSMLYADVVKLSQTNNMELKKLVYLYIINNSKLQPEKAILAVNTFIQDCQHENPVVRALAVRTMLCIRVEEVLDYTIDPLKQMIRDNDPYVRKTAALGVLKLYAVKPRQVEEHGLIDSLHGLLMDSSPMVISNTVIALEEIDQLSMATNNGAGSCINKEVTASTLNILLNALPECTEWGQIVILDYIAANYIGASTKDVENLLDRIMPRLSHLNLSIVLSSIRVAVKFLEAVSMEQKVNYMKKLAPAIVTLLSSQPETQYIVLRNIMIIIQKYPELLSKEVKAFFCKYNDPTYVKMEKLTILLKLLNEKNYISILSELKEYCSEVDIAFVKRAIKSIGLCALKIECSSEKCIEILLSLMTTKTDQLLDDCVIVIKDILRKYEGRFDAVIGVICENLDSIESVDAKQSLIWLIGEYADKIEDPMELLQLFIENFQDEPTIVQIQILVATVKIFLRYPDTNQGTLQEVLKLCAEDSDNPDLRDRAIFYWRLLSNDGMIDKLGDIVLGPKPALASDEYSLPRPLLDELLSQLNTLAACYHRMPSSFVVAKPMLREGVDMDEEEEDDPEIINLDNDSSMPGVESPMGASPTASTSSAPPAASTKSFMDDLDDLFGSPVKQTPPPQAQASAHVARPPVQAQPQSTADLLFGEATSAMPEVAVEPVLNADKGKGLVIAAGFGKGADGRYFLRMVFENTSQSPMMGFAIQFNKNMYGISNQKALQVPSPLLPVAKSDIQVELHTNAEKTQQKSIQIAIKNNNGVFYFAVRFPFHIAFDKQSAMPDKKEFIGTWKGMPDDKEFKFNISKTTSSVDTLKARFSAYNVYFVAHRSTDSSDNVYFSLTAFGERILLELVISKGADANVCCCKLMKTEFLSPFQEAINTILDS